jgi:Putative DNA-binding domain
MQADWQSGFSAAVLDPNRPLPPGVNGKKRFAVYRNNVVLGLTAALAANFPAIKRLVGDAFFAHMAKIFVSANPPRSRLLAEYGGAFPDFLGRFEPLAAYPYMPHVARLELAWLAAFHEADAAPLAGEELAGLAPEQLAQTRFIAHPATRLLAFPYAAVSIMAANRRSEPVPVIDPAPAEFGLVTRPQLDVHVTRVSASAHAFLASLLADQSLGEAADLALKQDQTFDLAANLRCMLAAGVFSKIH